MDCATMLFILVFAGVNFGWQASPDDAAGYEYIVQIEPELVDAMRRGASIPIESNVPAEVAPIRKVRVVVGRGELPREPLQYRANFAGQPGWTPDRYPAAPTEPSSAQRYPSQPPSLLGRTGTALSESGTAISDGVQAGMRTAQEQFSRTGSQVMNNSQQAAQQFGQQLQSAGSSVHSATERTLDATGNQIRQAANSLGLSGNSPPPSTAASGVSAPPWPQASTTSANTLQDWPAGSPVSHGVVTDTTSAPGMAVTRTASGWTSIGTNVAAPPPLIPPLTVASSSNSGLRVAQNTGTGPNLGPPASSSSSEPLHSVLVDPSRPPVTTSNGSNDWGNSWTTGSAGATATIGRTGDQSRGTDAMNSSGLITVPPRYPSQQNTQSAADRWGDPWAESDPWKQQSQQPPSALPEPPGSSNNVGAVATNDGWPTNTSNSTNAPSAPLSDTSPPEGQPIIGRSPATSTAVGFGANSDRGEIAEQRSSRTGAILAGGNIAPPANTTEQQPWMPLLLVSLSLVGSLSANFYLVLSYICARQRYVSLVKKTADTFRRVAGAAAA